MKKILALCCCAVAVTGLLAVQPRSSAAAGWDDTLRSLTDTGTINSGETESGSVYTASYAFTVTDYDGTANNFDGADRLRLTLGNVYDSSQSLSFEGTRAELVLWAEANANELYAILFMGSPDRSIAGESTGSALSSQGIGRIFRMPMHDIRLSAQYDFFEVGTEKISTIGPSGLLSYVSLAEGGEHAIGIEIPFRALTADDAVNTSLVYLMLNPFYEYSVTGGPNRFSATASANIGATSVDSDFFGGRAGFVNYGLTLGAGVGRTLARRLEGRLGIAYQYLERYVPESQMPDDFEWLGKALNDAEAEQTLTPGVGLTAWVAPETASLDLNLFHVYQLGSDVPDEFKNQTIVNAYVTLTPGHWQVRLGYKTSFGLEDLTDRSIVASLRYLW